MKLGPSIRLVYAMLHPQALNERPAIPWFRRLLDEAGTDVGLSTVYRWVEEGQASEDHSRAVAELLFRLATQAQDTRLDEIGTLEKVK